MQPPLLLKRHPMHEFGVHALAQPAAVQAIAVASGVAGSAGTSRAHTHLPSAALSSFAPSAVDRAT